MNLGTGLYAYLPTYLPTRPNAGFDFHLCPPRSRNPKGGKTLKLGSATCSFAFAQFGLQEPTLFRALCCSLRPSWCSCFSSLLFCPPVDRPDATVERCFISAAFFLLHLRVFQVLLWTVVGFFTPVLCFSRQVRLFVTCTMDIVSEPFPLLSWFGFRFLQGFCMYVCS